MNWLTSWLRVSLIDLRGGARRFVVLIACLALGVAAIGTVSAVRSSVETAIARDVRLLLGGDLELQTQGRDAEPAVIAALNTLGSVSREVQLSTQARAGDRNAFLSLRAVTESYPLIGSVTLASGETEKVGELLAPQDGQFGVLLSSQAAMRLAVGIGDTVRIGTLELQMRGIIEALPDQATAGFQLGAPALISTAALGPAGLREQGVLNQFRYKALLDGLSFEAARAQLEEEFVQRDWQIRSPREATAAIARTIEVFGNFLLLVALSSMVVGGLGAANAVTAYIGERQGAIATMRALGAKGDRLQFHFLTQIAALSFIAVIGGLIIVGAATLSLLPLLSGLIGINLPPVLDLQSMLVAAAIGMLTALLFTWVPLLQARAIRPALLFRAGSSSALDAIGWRRLLTPGAAIPLLAGLIVLFALTLRIANDPQLVAIYFAGTLVAFALLRAAADLVRRALMKMPPLENRMLRHAVSAIIRPGAPTRSVLVSMGLGLSLLLLIIMTQTNINSQITAEVSAEAPDFIVLDMDREGLSALERFAEETPQVATLTSTPLLRGTITELDGRPAPSSETLPREVADMFEGDTTLTWAGEMPAGTLIDQGEWWANDYDGPPLASLSAEMRDSLALEPGNTITISIAGRPLTMTIANFREVDWRSPTFNFRIIVSPGLIESAPQSFFGTIEAAAGEAQAVEATLIRTLPQLNFVPVGEALAQVQGVLNGLVNAVLLVSATSVLTGMLVLAGALSVGRRQREADAVVMKVLGARRTYVVLAFLVEYAFLGAIAALLAGGIALAAAWAAASFLLDIDFAAQPLQLAAFTAAIIVVTTATGAATTWSAMSRRPVDQLREKG
ncbi:glycosyl transferase family 1 [Devosia pacifica]|uniref:Glycosyl transferase family 1 n=1 Tax=Devosia pacifica TaxID=1335967 RepID=A0A918SAG9_9HYPH|nr:FtsX-like permease family protein [Devosia pacifica]GHA32925.1 glycosyl transferase family 1 [Devosia pacifica]